MLACHACVLHVSGLDDAFDARCFCLGRVLPAVKKARRAGARKRNRRRENLKERAVQADTACEMFHFYFRSAPSMLRITRYYTTLYNNGLSHAQHSKPHETKHTIIQSTHSHLTPVPITSLLGILVAVPACSAPRARASRFSVNFRKRR
jgi:hypothetical protein